MTPRSITPNQIQHLLDVYHGKIAADLSANIQVDVSRTKGVYRHYLPFFSASTTVTKIESLLKEIRMCGVRGDEDISACYLAKLRFLVKQGENERSGSATQLLCKRISAVMHSDMEQRIVISESQLLQMIIFSSATFLLRIGMDFFPAEAFMCACVILAALPLLTFTVGNELTKEIIAGKTLKFRLYDNHPLVKKSIEFARRLQLSACPKIFMDHEMLNASTYSFSVPRAEGGMIVMGKPLMDRLDAEEQYAVLAHEFGHIKDLLPFPRHYLRLVSEFGLPLVTAGVSWLVSRLAQQVLNEKIASGLDALSWLLMLYYTIKLTSKARQLQEIYADNVAKELVGPLAQSSSMRKLHLLSRHDDDKFIAAHPDLIKFLISLGLDDMFSSHPGEMKRMKI